MVRLLLLILVVFWVGPVWAFNPLKAEVRTVYPSSLHSVGEAVEYLSEPWGYKLVLNPAVSPDAQEISALPIPARAEGTKAISLGEALLLLIGDGNSLVVDHEHKLISFEKSKGGK